MKLSPTRVGTKRHSGQTPASSIMLFVCAVESRASPGAVAVARVVVRVVVVLHEIPAGDVVDVPVVVVVDAVREELDQIARVEHAVAVDVGHAGRLGVVAHGEDAVAVAVEAGEVARAAARAAVGVRGLVVHELFVVEVDLLDEIGVVPLDARVGDDDDHAGVADRVAPREVDAHARRGLARDDLVVSRRDERIEVPLPVRERVRGRSRYEGSFGQYLPPVRSRPGVASGGGGHSARASTANAHAAASMADG